MTRLSKDSPFSLLSPAAPRSTCGDDRFWGVRHKSSAASPAATSPMVRIRADFIDFLCPRLKLTTRAKGQNLLRTFEIFFVHHESHPIGELKKRLGPSAIIRRNQGLDAF